MIVVIQIKIIVSKWNRHDEKKCRSAMYSLPWNIEIHGLKKKVSEHESNIIVNK